VLQDIFLFSTKNYKITKIVLSGKIGVLI